MNIDIIDPSRFIGMDLAKTIRRGIKSEAQPILEDEIGRVIDRTPYWKGALQADTVGTANEDPDDPEIAHLYTGTENQLAEWHRVYAMYVEGPKFGLAGMWDSEVYEASGGTFDGWHMFGDAETQDTPAIEEHGLKGVERGINDIVSGRGYRA